MRQLEEELQQLRSSGPLPTAGAPTPAAVDAGGETRESLVSLIGLPVTDFGDVSILSDVSDDDEAMRAFNSGVGRRYTEGALARALSEKRGRNAAPPAPLYEAVLDYTTTTTAGRDLHFKAGDRIRVTAQGQEGWWYEAHPAALVEAHG